MKEVVTTGLGFPEGPVVLPGGRVAYCEQYYGRIGTYDRSTREVATLAVTGGSPNGATLGSDNALYIAQNGGVVGDWHSDPQIAPGIQRVGLDGTVERLCSEVAGVPLIAPNDICFGSDGRLYFTDPAHGYDPENRSEDGRIYALSSGGAELAVRRPPVYTNGVGVMPDGRLIWVESYERDVYVLEDSSPRKLCRLPENHLPDGFAVASDGRIFIATFSSHGISMVGPGGEFLGHIHLDDDCLATNCAFDGSTLLVTDVSGYPGSMAEGRLWRVQTDAEGMTMNAGTL